MSYKIPLNRDTINKKDLDILIEWLKTYPQLTKGKQTLDFQHLWSAWNEIKYSVYVNSGSSANLIAYYALMLSGRLKNKKVVVPAVSWATTVAPIMQLGLEPIICDCNMKNLGLDLNHLKKILKEEKPALIVTVNVLGFANDYKEILELCEENKCLLLEDSCESIGTVYNNKKTGNFGIISTFSYYFGHHMSTIEGGMVCTNDEELNDLIVSIRSHGWDRDLRDEKKRDLRTKYNIEDFKALYTFYYPGFNFRATDLQAFIGIEQLKKLDDIVEKRKNNFEFYTKNSKLKSTLDLQDHQLVSNFAFPVINKNIKSIVKEMNINGIETRPLICGSIGKQPFWFDRYGVSDLQNANIINEYGIYLPNNPSMTEEEIIQIVNILNKHSDMVDK